MSSRIKTCSLQVWIPDCLGQWREAPVVPLVIVLVYDVFQDLLWGEHRRAGRHHLFPSSTTSLHCIVGPPGVGKTWTTLLKRPVRHYANRFWIRITVVSGKKNPHTFVECNDLNSMIDIGEIADLVLLMVDGSFGFEMVCTIHPLQNLFLK